MHFKLCQLPARITVTPGTEFSNSHPMIYYVHQNFHLFLLLHLNLIQLLVDFKVRPPRFLYIFSVLSLPFSTRRKKLIEQKKTIINWNYARTNGFKSCQLNRRTRTDPLRSFLNFMRELERSARRIPYQSAGKCGKWCNS